MRGGRFSRGWELTKKSWAVLRADRSPLAFPVVSLVAGIGALAVIMGPGIAVYDAEGDAEWVLVVFGVVAAYVLTFIAICSQVALAACADRALRGEHTTVGEGLRAAAARLGPILGWSLLQAPSGWCSARCATRAGPTASWARSSRSSPTPPGPWSPSSSSRSSPWRASRRSPPSSARPAS